MLNEIENEFIVASEGRIGVLLKVRTVESRYALHYVGCYDSFEIRAHNASSGRGKFLQEKVGR